MSELRRKAPKTGMAALCGLFGRTRQAYYARQREAGREALESTVVVERVQREREAQPRMGTRKLHVRIKGDLQAMGIKMGRDALFDLLREERLLIRRRRRGSVTTQSHHRFRCYQNLLEGLAIDRPEQAWVADVTYLRVGEGFAYLSLVTDAYSRKIMGYHLHPTLEASGCVRALEMALKNRQYEEPLIHHSDRGIQYCSHDYTARLTKAGVAISMSVSGSAENAIAERVNGILKSEYLLDATFESFEAALRQTKQAITLYNHERPHLSLDMATPEQTHQRSGPLQRQWKDYRRRQRQALRSPQTARETPPQPTIQPVKLF